MSPQMEANIRLAQRWHLAEPPFLVVAADGLMAGISDSWVAEDGRTWWRGSCAECLWESRRAPFREAAEARLIAHVDTEHEVEA